MNTTTDKIIKEQPMPIPVIPRLTRDLRTIHAGFRFLKE